MSTQASGRGRRFSPFPLEGGRVGDGGGAFAAPCISASTPTRAYGATSPLEGEVCEIVAPIRELRP